MAETLREMAELLDAKRKELAAIFTEHKKDGKLDMSLSVVENVRARNDELTELAKKFEDAKSKEEKGKVALQELERIEAENRARIEAASKGQRPPFEGKGGSGGYRDPMTEILQQQAQRKSVGELFTEHAAYVQHKGTRSQFTVELPEWDPVLQEQKTLFQTTAGWAPFSPRLPQVILSPQRRLVVADVIPQDTVGAQGAIKFMKETTFTNNAAATAEGGTYPESALVFTEQTSNIQKIANSLPVTDEQLADVPQARSVIDNRLMFMVGLAEETELLTGNGTSPHLRGFLNLSALQTQAVGTDPVTDAVFKAITLVRFTGFANPTAIIMNPTNWQTFRLLRTADGIYIFGSPMETGPERLWGLSVVVTPAITLNTGLVGDFQQFSQIYRRAGIEIEVTNSHASFFTSGELMIRAQERLALVVYRDQAFCQVTGLT